MESAANKLQKEAKGYLDSLRGSPMFPLRWMILIEGDVELMAVE